MYQITFLISVFIVLVYAIGYTSAGCKWPLNGKRLFVMKSLDSANSTHYEDKRQLGMAVGPLISAGVNALKSINEDFFENEAMACYWNEWKERDRRAHIERTYGFGRFSKVKKFLFFNNGNWYCCYKQAACVQQGIPLDPPAVPFCTKKREEHEVARVDDEDQEKRQVMSGIKAAVNLGMALIGSITSKFYESDAVVCWWNKWEDRDARARQEGTYNYGRMAMYKKTFGIKNGKWYCCYKKAGLEALGQPLDNQSCVPKTGNEPPVRACCGGHSVEGGCANCPMGHGAAWCNGVCHWSNGRCV